MKCVFSREAPMRGRGGSHQGHRPIGRTATLSLDRSIFPLLSSQIGTMGSPCWWIPSCRFADFRRGLVTARDMLCWHEPCHHFCVDGCLLPPSAVSPESDSVGRVCRVSWRVWPLLWLSLATGCRATARARAGHVKWIFSCFPDGARSRVRDVATWLPVGGVMIEVTRRFRQER